MQFKKAAVRFRRNDEHAARQAIAYLKTIQAERAEERRKIDLQLAQIKPFNVRLREIFSGHI